MLEFGLFFGSIASVPFNLLTIFLVERYVRHDGTSTGHLACLGGISPLLVAVVGLIDGTILLPYVRGDGR